MNPQSRKSPKDFEEEFKREVALVRQNHELMEFLDQRSRPSKTYTIDEARKLLGIDRSE